MRHIIIAAAILAIALPLTACKTMVASAITTAGQVAGPVPNQVATVGEALQAATLVTKAAQAYVDTAKLTPAQLAQVSADSDALHAAVTQLETDNAAGSNLNFAAVNAALTAWNTYSATLPH